MKKVISIFISLVMLLTSVFCVNFSAFAKDYDAGKISLGDNSAKVSDYEEHFDEEHKDLVLNTYWYSFTPSETGYYVFTSNCARSDDDNDDYLDPVVYCYNDRKINYTDYRSNDDGGEGLNFSLAAMLEADKTYYFRFCDIGNRTGEDLRITYTVEKVDVDVSIKLANKPVLYEGINGYYSTDRAGQDYFNYYIDEMYNEGTTVTITKNGVKTVYTRKAVLDEDGDYNYYFFDENNNKMPHEYDIDMYDAQYEKHVGIGNNVEIPVYVGNFLTTVTADVKPNPISSFEYFGNPVVSDKNISDDEEYDFKYYNYHDAVFYDGAKVKVNYTDGTSDIYTGKTIDDDEDGWYGFDFFNDNGDAIKYGAYIQDSGSNQSAYTPWTVGGNNIVYLMLAGHVVEVPVTVTATPTPAPTPTPDPTPTPTPSQPAPAQPSTPAPAPTAPTAPAPVQAPATTTAKPKNNKKVKISSVKKGKKSFTVKWKKVKGISGYQIQYSTNKKFKKGNKSVTVKGTKSTSKTVKKLKAKKTYYVRMRTYKTVDGKKIYSAWSSAKSVKTK